MKESDVTGLSVISEFKVGRLISCIIPCRGFNQSRAETTLRLLYKLRVFIQGLTS